MPTAAILGGGSLISNALGARGARRAGKRQAAAFREAGELEGVAFDEFGDIVGEASELEATGLERAGGIEAGGFRRAGGVEAGAFREAASGFDTFTIGGPEAAQQEAALSGALGPEAQQRAISAQVESPFTKFIEQRGRAQIGQGSAALGGLGGGERLKALTEFGQGVATQSLAQQLQNLRNVRQSGFGAQQNISDFIAKAGGAEGFGIRGAAGAEALGTRGAAGVRGAGLRGAGQAAISAAQARGRGITGAGAARAAGDIAQTGFERGAVGDIFTIGALEKSGNLDKFLSKRFTE